MSVVYFKEARYPKESMPVLAKIEHQGDLGKSTWYEVVYYDEEAQRWRSYHGSKTFEDGEQVICWTDPSLSVGWWKYLD